MLRFITAITLLLASPVQANGYVAISDQQTFLSLVSGKELRNRLWGVRLTVREDGSIDGRAFGNDVTGAWQWIDGYFCRQMLMGTRDIEYNCQLVEAENASQIRFTSDKGTGESAAFRID